MKHSFLFIIALGWLTGCSAVGDIVNPDDWPLEQSAKDWLHEQNGQVLTFRNTAGAVQTLRVRRRDENPSGPASKLPSANMKIEFTTLVYLRLPDQLDSVSVVAGSKNQLGFYYEGLPKGTTHDGRYLVVTLYTGNDHTQDLTNPVAAMLTNYTLGNHIYANVVVVKQVANWKGLAVPTALDDLYYSRTDGLVGFKTLDGQLWTRP